MSVELSFNEYGAGPPVVILHGLFGSKRNFSAVARQLTRASSVSRHSIRFSRFMSEPMRNRGGEQDGDGAVFTRRDFLATTTAFSACLVGRPPAVRAAASERLTLGFIGLGLQGTHLLGQFLAEPDIQVVAICDVEDLHYREMEWGKGKALGRAPACERVVAATGTPPDLVTDDFREVCALDGLDAVVIATPDHWHALCTLEAIARGKDVYCEKPVTHTFAEGQAVCRAVNDRDTVFQTGSQQRSMVEFRRAVELIRNGVLGDLERIEVGLPSGYETPMGSIAVMPPPDADAYDLWCGPVVVTNHSGTSHSAEANQSRSIKSP